jgi:hypothetical protein
LGLVVLSVLMINVFNTSNFVNPIAPSNAGPGGLGPPTLGNRPNGTLVVLVTSNQNTTSALAPPTNTSSDAKGVSVVATFAAASLPSEEEYYWMTNAQGLTGCVQCLPIGLYFLSIQYDGLNMTIPAQVSGDNQTLVQVSITGKVYPMTYSDESGVLVTPSSAQYTMFAQVSSSVPVANVSQAVSLTLSEGASEVATSHVNATVISQGAPTMGRQWLQLGTASPVNIVDVDSISMTVWTPSTITTVGPITYSAASLTAAGAQPASTTSTTSTT